ncbi:MAG: molybdopterin-dependent oxidoreductase [Adlercreutzia equolifaciens]
MEPVQNTTGALTRRGFLKTTAAAALVAGGVSAAGFAALTPKTASAQSDEKICTTYCNACMGCPLEAVVRDGNVVLTRAKEIEGAPIDQKRMCARGASIPTLIVREKRIQYPMKRAEGTERGAGQWERISWDEAIDTICTKIKEYQAEFGSGSVCSFTYGTTEPRNMYNLNRLENVAQFSHQNRTTDFALTQGTMYTAGGFYYQGGVDMDLVSQMNTFVVWGHNPIVSWPNAWHYIADAIENNDCKLIVVDPNKNTIGQKADLFVSLQPGADAALALGLGEDHRGRGQDG